MVTDLPPEKAEEHTRILRVMLNAEDSRSYVRHAEREDYAHPADADAVRRLAFENRWFGNKSEARVNTLLGDMALRFDPYPDALRALNVWSPPLDVFSWVCHFHVQLADPIYREFTGKFFPERLNDGYTSIDRGAVAAWVESRWPGRWAPTTVMKFAANMLSTGHQAGLFSGARDPRPLLKPTPPGVAVEYLLYLLREVETSEGFLDGPYMRSITPTRLHAIETIRGLANVSLSVLGDVATMDWAYGTLLEWAEAQGDAT